MRSSEFLQPNSHPEETNTAKKNPLTLFHELATQIQSFPDALSGSQTHQQALAHIAHTSLELILGLIREPQAGSIVEQAFGDLKKSNQELATNIQRTLFVSGEAIKQHYRTVAPVPFLKEA